MKEKNKPLVSIIIPSYNHGQWIEQCIESVLKQSYQNIEIIVIDDASKDDTEEILKKYLNNKKIKIIIKNENKGQGNSINIGVKESSGKYICLLSSDDWYLENKIEMQVKKMEELNEDVGVLYCKGYRYYQDTFKLEKVELPLYSGWVLDKLIKYGNFIYPITPMFRKICFDRVRFDENYKAEGEAIFMKIAMYYKFDYIEDRLVVMRDHGYNIGKNIEIMYEENIKYLNDFFNQDDLKLKYKKSKNYTISKIHRMKGFELIVYRKKYIEGREALIQSIKEYPKLLLDIKIILTILMITLLPVEIIKKIIDIYKR